MSLSSMVEDKESASRTMEPRTVQSDSHLDNLLVATNIELPWYKSVFKNIGEALNPPKLPPLELTSRPLEGAEMGALGED